MNEIKDKYMDDNKLDINKLLISYRLGMFRSELQQLYSNFSEKKGRNYTLKEMEIIVARLVDYFDKTIDLIIS